MPRQYVQYPSPTISQGAVQFARDGSTIAVSEDTATPANNRPLPTKIVDASGDVAVATSAKQDAQATLTGAVTEAAPASDTASSGLNGRLQRIAQRLTTLIGTVSTETTLAALSAKFASLGQKAMAGSAPVVIASDQSAIPASQSGTWNVNNIAGTVSLPTGAATSAKQDAEAILVGAVTETAPATDTASSGLNGRLQRVAQRLTSMIALLPASLGQKTMANALAVSIASDQSAVPVSAASLPLPTGASTSAAQATAQTSLTNLETFTNRTPQNANVTDSTNATVGTAAVAEAAPADAVGFILSADPSNTGLVFYRMGGTATITAGHPLEASRDTGFIPVKASLSIISDTAAQKYNLTWIRR
jgi:hypothetical protein